MNESQVNLICYRTDLLPLLEEYDLTNDQLNYTRSPHEAITISVDDPHRYPIIIEYAGAAVGFFVLHDWEGVKHYSDNENALLLRSYSIDSSYQGRGFAKQSLNILPAFVKEYFLGINEVILAVNWQNTHAQHVYKSCGFKDKGLRVMGRKGEQYILHLDV